MHDYVKFFESDIYCETVFDIIEKHHLNLISVTKEL